MAGIIIHGMITSAWKDVAGRLIADLQKNLMPLKGQRVATHEVTICDEFSYLDPIDNSLAEHPGIRIVCSDEARIVYRLSGTGTDGATAIEIQA
jgi:phosphoglucomutase